jgi:outer membrane protein insertion porin family
VIRIPQTESEKAEGIPIAKIEISGNRRVAVDDITTYLREKVGQLFRVENLSGDVHALWDAGFFDDIEVDLERKDQGVLIRFLVRERPNIKAIEFKGNDEIENDKLTEAIDIKTNTILSVPAVRRSVLKIKDAYSEKGYFLTDVDFKIDPQRDNEVVVKFQIAEHQPVTVRRVTFIGNESLSDAELRETIQTGNGGFLSFGSGGAYRQDMFERDILMINALYYDRGYMSVQIGTPRVMLTPDREGIEITVAIHEGPRFKIRQLKIFERDNDGKEVDPLGGRRVLRQMIRAHSGDWFSRAELVKDLTAVRTLYRDAGFANVEAEPETELDPVKSEVDIVIPIRRGPPVHVERIEIKGNTKTRDRILRREMEIQEGQLFSETGLERSKKRIPGQDHRRLRDRGAAHGHVSGRRRVQLGRELHRDGAGSASQPLRQRAVARAIGTNFRPTPARELALLRALFLGIGLVVQRGALRSALRLSVVFAHERGRVDHVWIRPHSARAAAQRDGDRRGGPGQYGAREHVLRLGDRPQHLSASPARQPFQ